MRFAAYSIAALALALIAGPAPAQEYSAEPRLVLTAFFNAFNDHDPDAMSQWVQDDIRVIYLSEGGEAGRVEGVAQLTASMQAYFEALPSAQTEILSVIEDGDHLAVRERASWTAADGRPRSQTALAVYRLESGLISAVWYFPETRDPD